MKHHTAADDFFRLRQRHWDEDEARRLAKGNEMKERIELGQKVKDTITGFTGIVIARYEYLHDKTGLCVEANTLTSSGKRHFLTLSEERCEVVPTN